MENEWVEFIKHGLYVPDILRPSMDVYHPEGVYEDWRPDAGFSVGSKIVGGIALVLMALGKVAWWGFKPLFRMPM